MRERERGIRETVITYTARDGRSGYMSTIPPLSAVIFYTARDGRSGYMSSMYGVPTHLPPRSAFESSRSTGPVAAGPEVSMVWMLKSMGSMQSAGRWPKSLEPL